MATDVRKVGADAQLLQNHSATTASKYYLLSKKKDYQQSRASVVDYRKKTGWSTGGDSETLQVDVTANTQVYKGLHGRKDFERAQDLVLTKVDTARSHPSVKREILNAIFSLRAPVVTARLLSFQRFPKYNRSSKKGTYDSLRGLLKLLCLSSRYVSFALIRAFGPSESPSDFWRKVHWWFRKWLTSWDPKGKIFKHVQVAGCVIV